MADFDLDIGINQRSWQKSLEEARDLGVEILGQMSERGGGVDDKLVERFRSTLEYMEGMADEAERFGKAFTAGNKDFQKRVEWAKELTKQHRELHLITKAERIQSAGGPGAASVGPNGGGVRRSGQAGLGWQQLPGGVQLAGNALLSSTSHPAMLGLGAQASQFGSQLAFAKGMGGLGFGLSGLGMALNTASQAAGREDDIRKQALQLFSTGGAQTANYLIEAMRHETGAGLLGGLERGRMDKGFGMYKYGILPQEATQLLGGLSKGAGSKYVNTDIASQLFAAHRLYGVGGQATGLMSAAERSGALSGTNEESQRKASSLLGHAIGVATATELDRGRWGESFEMMAGLMERASTKGDVDVMQQAQLLNVIGRMGSRFRGGSAAAQAQVGLVGQMAGDESGFGQLMSYQAAGGGDWLRTQFKIQSFGAQGGLTPKDVVERYQEFAAGWIKQYGVEGAAVLLSYMSPSLHGKAPEIRDMLLQQWNAPEVDVAGGTSALRAAAPSDLVKVYQAELDKINQFGQGVMNVVHDPGAFAQRMTKEGAAEVADLEGKTGRKLPPGIRLEDVRSFYQAFGRYPTSDADFEKIKSARREAQGSKGTRDQPLWQDVTPSSTFAPHEDAARGAGETGGDFTAANQKYLDDVTTDFGSYGRQRSHSPRTGMPYRHGGADMHIGSKRPVYAPIDGVVERVSKEGQLQWTVYLRGSDQRLYIFRHLAKPMVAAGQAVRRGTQLGIVSGELKAPHLHFEVQGAGSAQNDKSALVDPATAPFDLKTISEPSGVARGASSTAGGGLAASAGQSPAVPQPNAFGAGGVNIQVTVHDRTVGGVKPAVAAKGYAEHAMAAAPGDTPALSQKPGG